MRKLDVHTLYTDLYVTEFHVLLRFLYNEIAVPINIFLVLIGTKCLYEYYSEHGIT